LFVNVYFVALIPFQYSDGFYICTIIAASASATVSTTPPERGELLTTEVRVEHNAEDVELVKQTMAEVDRYRSMDRLIPSPHNIVTIAALEVSISWKSFALTPCLTVSQFYLVLTLANLIPSHPRVFFPPTRCVIPEKSVRAATHNIPERVIIPKFE
jgi:transcription initiation factor TFIID subunit 2